MLPAYCAYASSAAPGCHPYDPFGDTFNAFIAWVITLDAATFWELIGGSILMVSLLWLVARWTARLYIYLPKEHR